MCKYRTYHANGKKVENQVKNAFEQVMLRARRRLGTQLTCTEDVKRSCIEYGLKSLGIMTHDEFWGEYLHRIIRTLDSYALCSYCHLNGLNAWNVAADLVFMGKTKTDEIIDRLFEHDEIPDFPRPTEALCEQDILEKYSVRDQIDNRFPKLLPAA